MQDSDTGAGRFLGRLLTRRTLAAAGLAAIVIAAFLTRFLTLREIPFPPSSDAAGDLVWVHAYLGHSLPGYTIQQAAPPVYILGVVFPLTTAFGTFLGIQVLMALMPALLAIPAYLLMRWSGFGVVPGWVAGAALAFSPVYSDMVAWNSGFNVTGILFLILFFALWARAKDRLSWKPVALAGFGFSLVVGTHPLTAVYGGVTIAIYLVVAFASQGRFDLPRLGSTLRMLAFAALFSLPYLPLYLYTYTGLANVGSSSTSAGLSGVWTLLSSTPGFAWGANGPAPPLSGLGLFILGEMIATVLAIPLIWIDRRDRFLATICVAQVLAGALIVPLDSQNADRMLYFLPVAIVPLTVAWATRVAESERLRRGIARLRVGRPPLLSRRARAVARGLTVAVIVVGMVTATAYLSQSQMSSSETFYSLLDSSKLGALNWLKDNTPSNAAVFDGANLQSWIPGYAERVSYSPGALGGKITSDSYTRTYNANLIQLGTNVLGNPYLLVGSNSPGVYSTPGIYLRTQGGSVPLWANDASQTYVTVASAVGRSTVTLASASSVNTTGLVYANGTVSMSSTFGYAGLGFAVEMTAWLHQTTVDLVFAGENGTLTSVRTYWSLPPTGYYFSYDTVPLQQFNSSYVEELGLTSGGPVALGVVGSPLNGTVFTDSSGWTRLSLNFSSAVHFEAGGAEAVASGNGPSYVDTESLSAGLGIRYFVVSMATNYVVYQRLTSLMQANPASWTLPFESGNTYIFEGD